MSTTADPSSQAPAFVPLEANPELMTNLLHTLGLSRSLAVHDVYSLTEPSLLAFIPRPAHALLLVFPVSAAYESHRLAEDATVAVPLGPDERARLLERDPALAAAHQSAAEQGDTAAPAATDDVDLHYVCFVKGRDGALWELDGRRKGPLRRGDLDSSEDVLSEKALALGPLKFLEREAADLRFSCVALAGSLD
ncbi:cysteine proteinase [Thermothelomyces heterothallicus CBS 203.75]